MIKFELDKTDDEYRYYVWKISESDDGNGDKDSEDDNSNNGYVWGTIMFYTSQGNMLQSACDFLYSFLEL